MNDIDITLDGLRHRVQKAKKDSRSPAIGEKTFEVLSVMALAQIQIAQELNEIKHMLIKRDLDEF